MKLASRSFETGRLRTLYLEHGSVLCRQRHSLCALSSEHFPCISRIEDVSSCPQDVTQTAMDPVNPRLRWDMRLNRSTLRKWTAKTRAPFSPEQDGFTCYLPHVEELIKGLWALDQNPIWLIVDDLVATGEPHGFPDTCPDFLQWRHIITASNFSDATSTLVAQGHLRNQSAINEEAEIDEEAEIEEDEVDEEGDVGGTAVPSASTIPTWLVAFMLATMVKTRVAAYEGLAFCLSQLDTTPRRLRAPLLLLSMCSLSAHRVAVQVPVLLGAFRDIFFYNLVAEDSEVQTDSLQSLGSRESLIYQYNTLLTLLCRFPHVPGFERHTIQFLHHIEACSVPLETDTAKQLIGARFGSGLVVNAVRDILARQEISHFPEQADDLSVSLTRFYSQRFNLPQASKYAEGSRRIDPSKYVKTYLRAFRDAASSLEYLRAFEEAAHSEATKQTPLLSKAYSGPGREDNLDSSMSGVDQAQVNHTPLPKAGSPGALKHHIYTSLLHSAALSKSISASTFHDLFNTIREAHGDDRVIETVAMSGMLKRRAWDEAKALWAQWQTTNRTIQSLLRQMRSFVDKRQRVFGDGDNVRRTLEWSKETEYATWRKMKRLEVDADALSVAVRALSGPKPDSLPHAFSVMDNFALKVNGNSEGIEDSTHGEPSFDRPENIRLTSRVVNCFMARALYFRRPDVIFCLWDGMTSYYGVDSSVATLNILLRSTRLAASMETAIGKFVPKWMMGSLGFRNKPVFHNLSEKINWMLSPDHSPNMRWHGAPPWRVARRLFREEILFANWPYLRHIDVPARAVRGDEATGQIEALKELTTGRGLWGTRIKQMGHYSHLIPSRRTFKDYILMLGRVHRSSEIPEVLAWMKALNVPPSRSTLSVSLALWSQVGLESLADDAWDGAKPTRFNRNRNSSTLLGQPRHGGEYDKLLAWMEEWVGKEHVPGESEVLESFRYIQKLEEKEGILY